MIRLSVIADEFLRDVILRKIYSMYEQKEHITLLLMTPAQCLSTANQSIVSLQQFYYDLYVHLTICNFVIPSMILHELPYVYYL